MNEVPARNVSSSEIERLVLGIEPTRRAAAPRASRHPIDLVLDGVPFSPGRVSLAMLAGCRDPIGVAGTRSRDTTRAAMRSFSQPGMKSPIAIRMYDRVAPVRAATHQLSVPGGYPSAVAAVARAPAGAASRRGVRRSARRHTGLRGRVTWNQSGGQRSARAMGSGRGLDQRAGGRPSTWRRPRRISPASSKRSRRPRRVAIAADRAGRRYSDPARRCRSLPTIRSAIFRSKPSPQIPTTFRRAKSFRPVTPQPRSSSRPVTFQLGKLLTNQEKFFFNP